MNAGMFEADGTPGGMVRRRGQNRSRGPNLDQGEGNFFLKPNGVFALPG